MKIKKMFLAITIISLLMVSCNNDDDNSTSQANLTLNLNGLEDLGNDYVYEGWIIVNEEPISTGVFTSTNFPQTFSVNTNQLEAATKFVLTIEPAQDDDPNPSNTKYLVGDFSGNSADVNTAIVGDFSNAAGKYILATPTNGMPTNENSGIWFLDLPGGTPPPLTGLTLPTLPEGWKYEGWAVINGIPVTTGKFTNVNATDEFDGYSGPDPLGSPNGDDGFFPGEDFLENAPSGLTFPTDLAGMTAVISIEPEPDNSPNPFTLKPLVDAIPGDAIDHNTYTMEQNLGSLPTGTVTR
ncbi:MAG: anti-sigma factor domain-containing protein [Flavobacteriales bacterium]